LRKSRRDAVAIVLPPLPSRAAFMFRVLDAGHRIAFEGKSKDGAEGSFLRDRNSSPRGKRAGHAEFTLVRHFA
jgi:hypothetical protein